MPTGRGFELFGGVRVESVQRGSLEISSGGYLDVTISPVNVSNSVVIVVSTPGIDRSDMVATGYLVNSTTLRLERFHSTGKTKVSWQVVEFTNAKSIQSGIFTLSSTLGTQTISPINTSKAILFVSATPGDSVRHAEPWGRLVDATTLEFGGYRVPPNPTKISWYVVEFN